MRCVSCLVGHPIDGYPRVVARAPRRLSRKIPREPRSAAGQLSVQCLPGESPWPVATSAGTRRRRCREPTSCATQLPCSAERRRRGAPSSSPTIVGGRARSCRHRETSASRSGNLATWGTTSSGTSSFGRMNATRRSHAASSAGGTASRARTRASETCISLRWALLSRPVGALATPTRAPAFTSGFWWGPPQTTIARYGARRVTRHRAVVGEPHGVGDLPGLRFPFEPEGDRVRLPVPLRPACPRQAPPRTSREDRENVDGVSGGAKCRKERTAVISRGCRRPHAAIIRSPFSRRVLQSPTGGRFTAPLPATNACSAAPSCGSRVRGAASTPPPPG
jgi:hypothetical protein